MGAPPNHELDPDRRPGDDAIQWGSAARWSDLIESTGPASLLVAIEQRMGRALLGRVSPEDVLQESLLMAWRDRASHQWRGLRAFRNWLLSIIDHRISDLRDHASTQKRGGHVHTHGLETGMLEPWASTTPSRVATVREQATAMKVVLDSLPPELQQVVRLKLVDHLHIDEIAAHLGIGASAVRHRFRRGAELFRNRLTSHLGTTPDRTNLPNPSALGGQVPSTP